MSVTIFVHLNESEHNNFDITTFNQEMEKKYPGNKLEVRDSERFDLCWENYSEQYQFELRMDTKRSTFAIEYFHFDETMDEYARFILWLASFLEEKKK